MKIFWKSSVYFRRGCLSSLVLGFHPSERPAMLSEAHAFRDSCSLTFVIAIKRAAPFSGSAFEWVNYETLLTVTFVKIWQYVVSSCRGVSAQSSSMITFRSFFTSQLRTILLFFLFHCLLIPNIFFMNHGWYWFLNASHRLELKEAKSSPVCVRYNYLDIASTRLQHGVG